MDAQDFPFESQILGVINSVLDGILNSAADPFSVSSLAASYFSISDTLQQQNFEVQNISINGNEASTEVTTSAGPDLFAINLQLSANQWSIIP